MDSSEYVNGDGESMQWTPDTHHHHHHHHEAVKTNAEKNSNTNANETETLLESQSSEYSSDEHVIVNNGNYVAAHDHGTDGNVTNIDQIAAENLIFMARDGQMMTTNAIANENDTIVMTSNEGPSIRCENVMRQDGLIIQPDDSSTNGIIYGNSHSIEHYIDNTPQMVTEEIITDDWVQHQGEERVEIPAEQIIGSGSHILLDMEVPLSTVQDEYSVLRPYPCDFCSRRFRKKASLMNHMVAHQNDRPHLCKLCNSRFLRRQDLINHLKAHAEEEPALDDNDNDFLHFEGGVGDTTNVNQRRSTNDNEYDEHSWNISNESIPLYIKGSPKANKDIAIVTTNITEMNFNVNPITSQAGKGANEMTYDGGGDNNGSKSSITRGRISRLKPKRNISYDADGDDENNSIGYNDNDQLHYTDNGISQENSNKQMQQKSAITSKRCKPFVCQECGLGFAREKALIAHRKGHRHTDSYECNYCQEVFWDDGSLREHLKVHQFEESDSEYEPNDDYCDIKCHEINYDDDDADADNGDNIRSQNGKCTTRTNELNTDRRLYGDFYCPECGISFHRLDRLKTHAKLHRTKDKEKVAMDNTYDSNSKIYKHHHCHTCGETFAEALDLLAHAEIHARYSTYKCALCGETFIEESKIKRHLQNRHSNEMTENSCILCGKECRDRKALVKHAWDHSLEKCHTCTKCGKNFHNKARLRRHWASHRDKSVQCEICRKEFPDGRILSNHRHSHSTTSNGKLFPCTECGKTFGSRSSQQIHLRIHTGEKPYGCRYCWKAFADGGTLRKHERIHTGEKPYVCSVCTRAFNQRVVLREHIRSHHSSLDNNRGTFYCRVCSADMSTSRELIQHLIEHSDVNTAKQRQPVTGPRKYTRRRKLKPHELARLKDKGKLSLDVGSFSDLDMSDIDEMNAVNGSSTITFKDNNQNPPNNNRKEKIANKNNKKGKFEIEKKEDSDCEVDGDLVMNYDNHTSDTNKLNKISQSLSSKATTTTATMKKKLNHKESVFNKLKNTLNKNNNDLPDINKKRVLRHKQIHNLSKSGQKTKTAKQLNKTPIIMDESVDMAQCKALKMQSTTKRIEKNEIKIQDNVSLENENKSRKDRKSITKNLAPLMSKTSSTIVDDYDIISPELQPPKQISCSPVRIKQEESHEFESKLNDNCHQQLQSATQTAKRKYEKVKQNHELKMNNQNSRIVHNTTTPIAPNDIYDAHLLLEASGLRHDLDDMILQTPIRMGKDERRQRYGSESSFMTDQTVEEQLLIKIEPTSPDLREIVNGVVNMINNNNNDNNNNSNNNYNNGNCTSDMKLLEHHGKRTCNADINSRHEAKFKEQQQMAQTGKGVEQHHIINITKYLTFPVIDVASNKVKHSTARNPINTNNNNTINVNTTSTSMPNKTSPSPLPSSPLSSPSVTLNVTSYLDYNDFRTTYAISSSTSTSAAVTNNSSRNSRMINDEFASISAVVSAADANAAAAKQLQLQHQKHQHEQQQEQQQQQQPLKFRRYFECEMCSMVFSDRAQLLDHVPIHI